jgi:Flp pilus assembly pilin Flp
MTSILQRLRCMRDDSHGSVPLQYAILAAGTALVAMAVAETASNKVADRLNAVTSALNKIQF